MSSRKELVHIRGQRHKQVSKLSRVRPVLQMLAIAIDISQAEDFHGV